MNSKNKSLSVKKKEVKPEKGWCIHNGASLLIWSCNWTRRDTIRDYEKHMGKDWETIKSWGHTCKKVIVTSPIAVRKNKEV